MPTVKSLLKPALQPFLRPLAKMRAKSGLADLNNLGTPASQQIARAIEQALEDMLSEEERDWVTRIERKRDQLNDSKDRIQQIDFGAGKQGENRTRDEMEHGFMVESSIGEISKSLSKPYFWSVLLFKLVREFQPDVALELGTAVGISAAYQGAAQKLNGHGRTVSLEGNQSFADLAARNLQELGLDNISIVCGRFADTLEGVCSREKPLSYVFVDGHHDEVATVEYFEQLIPYLAPKSLIVFDDISWSAGMHRAWQRIAAHDKCAISVDLDIIGLCVIDDEIDNQEALKVPLQFV